MAGPFNHAILSALPADVPLDQSFNQSHVTPVLSGHSTRLVTAMQAYTEVRVEFEKVMASPHPADASLKERLRHARALASEAWSALASARVETAADLVFKLAALSPFSAFLDDQQDFAKLTLLALLEDGARLRTARYANWSFSLRRSQGVVLSSWFPWSRPREPNGGSSPDL